MKRREFVKSTAMAAGIFVMPFRRPLKISENPIKIAVVGTGWWGREFLIKNIIASGHYDIIGLCDVNTAALDSAVKIIKEAGGETPKLFSAYKEMYEMAGLESVVIATPTCWHPLQFIDACKAGLHVFLEKPISYDIREGQAMLAAHQQADNVVMVDFPRVMMDTNDQIKAFIDSGEAGKIMQVKANIINPEGPLVEKEIPATMDYETFCGPAPKLKYLCRKNGDTPIWRGQHGFNRGVMVDWGIHYIHNARKVLDLGLPTNVSAIGGITRDFGQDNPDHLDVRYDFDGLPVYWSHKSWGYVSPSPDNNIGLYFYGEKATIFSGDNGWEVYPAGGGEKIVHGDIRFNPGEPAFFEAVLKAFNKLFTEFAVGVRNKSNEGITNTFEDAHKTTSTVIYGDMAYRVNAGLTIDKATMDITNNAKAHALLKREYRAPYQHPWT